MLKSTLVGALLLTATSLVSQSLSDNYRDPSLTLGQEVITDATYYAAKFNGRPTSSGELINPKIMTGAMHTFPFNEPKTDFKYFRVTRLDNGVKTNRSIIVKVNDHMPDRHAGIDLSQAAAEALDMIEAGRVDVVIERVSGPDAAPIVRPTTPVTTVDPTPTAPTPVTPPAPPTQPLPRLSQTSGLAITYADQYIGMKTKSGEPYDATALTGGHRSLPMGTLVRVTRPDNQLSTVVRINDSGPRSQERVIDLSHAAAKALGIDGPKLVQVNLEVVPPGTVPGVPAERSPVVVDRTPATTPVPTPFGQESTTRQGYGVQVAFSTNSDGARQLAQSLRGQLAEPVMVSTKVNAASGRTEYRVVVGAATTRQQAVALRERLANTRYKDAFIVALQNM